MKLRLLAMTLALPVIASCSSVQVREVQASSHPISLVCIKNDPTVLVVDLLGVIEDGFQRHGIETKVFDDDLPDTCKYSLTYAAGRSWDVAPYMNHAELRLKEGNKIIGSATYHHKGGFGFNKWASTASKMDPVIDKLLEGFDGN